MKFTNNNSILLAVVAANWKLTQIKQLNNPSVNEGRKIKKKR